MNRNIHFAIPYDEGLMVRARTVPRARWNKPLKLWEVPESRVAWLALEEAGLLDRVVAPMRQSVRAEKPVEQPG